MQVIAVIQCRRAGRSETYQVITTYAAVTWGKSQHHRWILSLLIVSPTVAVQCSYGPSIYCWQHLHLQVSHLADKIIEVATPTSAISAVCQSQLSSELEELCSQISNLEKLVQWLSTCQRRDPPHTHSSSPALQRSQSDLCWYNKQFGDSAKKSREPCSKSGKASASSH